MKIKIAIQKSGRMHDDSIRILKECGLEVDKSKDQLKAAVNGFPAELLFLRNSDIPKYLEDGAPITIRLKNRGFWLFFKKQPLKCARSPNKNSPRKMLYF